MSQEEQDFPIIAPSLLAADFADVKNEVQEVESGGADWHHFDVMDGHFVPNITIGPAVLNSLRKRTGMPIDVHLMIESPWQYFSSFGEAGASCISFHVESLFPPQKRCREEKGYYLPSKPDAVSFRTEPLLRAKSHLETIQELGMKAGIAINPGTNWQWIQPLIDTMDYLLVMTVWPGFSGQDFMSSPLEKMSPVKDIRPSLPIEVDGGVSPTTAPEAKEAGADIFVSGSSVFGKSDKQQAVRDLRQAVL